MGSARGQPILLSTALVREGAMSDGAVKPWESWDLNVFDKEDVSEEEDNAEDAIFLISEVLYGKWNVRFNNKSFTQKE